MSRFKQYQTMVSMAARSLRRLSALGTHSLGASTLVVYLHTDAGKLRRAFATPDFPEPNDQEMSDHERDFVGMLPGDDVRVVEATADHLQFAKHPWITEVSEWQFVASAPLIPSKSATPVGQVIVAGQDAHHLDDAGRARLVDLATLIIERLELQQSQAQVAAEMDRMITIGILAAGVAHEINNPLSFVGGNIQFALSLLDEDFADPELPAGLSEKVEEIQDALNDALVGSSRVHDVVKDLHRLAGGSTNDDFTVEPVNLLDPLRSSLNIARKHIEQRARLVTNLDKVADIMGNQSKLGQVFLNLLINAAQAIPKGRINTNEVRVRTSNRDGDVVVSISDTGTGISEKNLAHIFDPYFTTKSRNEGTGLGLAISHNIVTTLSGDIEIDTELGRGTTFHVVLPSVAKAIGSIEPA